jgi:hypothetical protein
VITQQDREDYGDDFINFSRRAAVDAVQPALAQLRYENQHLRQIAQRSQRADIERALDQQVPDWRTIYADSRFADWLARPDDYSGGIRSQLMRHAVANGDVSRVVAFYRGFQRAGHAPAAQYGRTFQSRPAAIGGQILTRPQIAMLYERRRKGEISDADWARTEAQIFAAANAGRVAGALGPDGTEVSRLAR